MFEMPYEGGEMKWDHYIRCASNKLSYICNNSPIFGRSFTCTRIRDRGRTSKYNRKHNCCVIGVWGRVIGVRKTHHCHRHFEKMTVDDWAKRLVGEYWRWVRLSHGRTLLLWLVESHLLVCPQMPRTGTARTGRVLTNLKEIYRLVPSRPVGNGTGFSGRDSHPVPRPSIPGFPGFWCVRGSACSQAHRGCSITATWCNAKKNWTISFSTIAAHF